MQTFVLRENVLSDNLLHIADDGKTFKGGYIAIIEEYSFESAWSDKLSRIIKFRKTERLNSFLEKHYPDSDIEVPSI